MRAIENTPSQFQQQISTDRPVPGDGKNQAKARLMGTGPNG